MDLKTQRIQKNINDNSPIISHYIKNIGFDSSKLPYFVQSYEISRVPKEYPFIYIYIYIYLFKFLIFFFGINYININYFNLSIDP